MMEDTRNAFRILPGKPSGQFTCKSEKEAAVDSFKTDVREIGLRAGGEQNWLKIVSGIRLLH
jgi:hypothetical protein